MTAIAETLDSKLRAWPPGTSQMVERLVNEIIELADKQSAGVNGERDANGWPKGFFEATAGSLAGIGFERPPQGEFEVLTAG